MVGFFATLMSKRGAQEMTDQGVPHEAHPYAFHVSGPRSLTNLGWRDNINSSWKDANYKRTVIACLVRAVYLLELDRQENRTQENALAPNWWIPFKYKLTQTLIDERDGSIFGAIFEWDRSAALAESVLIRPRGAPRAVLALRGTLLKSPTMQTDIVDDLRFFTWESLEGSVRFNVALVVLKSVSDTHGSRNVCIVGHSLGAGFAFQVGKVLANEGIYVDTHLFNPPSVSLVMSLGKIGEKAKYVWNRLKSSSSEAQVSNDGDKTSGVRSESWIHLLSGLKDAGFGARRWVLHLYVNKSDYICGSYIDSDGTEKNIADKENMGPTNGKIAAKMFIVSKDKQKFLEAHGLQQWWKTDAELQQAICNSKLLIRQLESLDAGTPWLVTHLFNPLSVSLAMSLGNIGERAEFVWKWNRLKSMLPSGSKAHVSNDGDKTSGVNVYLASRIPQLSGFKDAGFWVGNWVPHLYFNTSDYISRQLRTLYTGTPNLPSVSLAMSLQNSGETTAFVWMRLKSMLYSGGESQVSKDGNRTSGVQWKSWIPQYSLLKDAGFGLGKWVPHLFVSNTDYICTDPDATGEKTADKEIMGTANGQIAAKLLFYEEKRKFLEAYGLEQWWSSDTELQRAIYNSKLISRQLRSSYIGAPWQVTHLFDPPSVSVAMSLRRAHGLEQWWSSDEELQQAIHNSKLISWQLRSFYTSSPSQVKQGKPG